MKQFTAPLAILWCIFFENLYSQPVFTANDFILPYTGFFRAGVNPGAHPPFSGQQLADLSAGNPALEVPGVGCTAWRPALFEGFLEEYGYAARADAFEHAFQIGLRENTVIAGFPNEAHRDKTQYCGGKESTLFANMYEPIWDGGANGTPVNDQNFYALYLWKMVNQYKKHVRFWEIWNEPGYDFTGLKGYLLPGQTGNWWENNPDPCDYKLHAPIFHYIRMLRISYEVIKTVDPNAYVLCGGVGYPSFLDAILRNTDNPIDGAASANFPKKGGAYFDVLGFHAYPHFDASTQKYNDTTQNFDYTRHSDGAANGIGIVKKRFEPVFAAHGYDGVTFPKKLWTITECNIPRKPFTFPLGSSKAQANYLIKSWVACLREDFLQLHIYAFSEETEFDKATYEFDLMGLYKKLNFNDLYHQKPTDEGIALKTANDLMFEKTVDFARTSALNLPNSVGGAALKDVVGNYTYVLWAKTATDLSEVAEADFSFPTGLVLGEMSRREWDYSKTQISSSVAANATFSLTSAPSFFIEKTINLSQYSGCAPFTIQYSDGSNVAAATTKWTFSGGNPTTTTGSSGSVTFAQSGSYQIFLEKKDAAGQTVFLKKETILVGAKPTADFSGTLAGSLLFLKNKVSANTIDFLWNFGDNTTSVEPNPIHTFYQNGLFSVKLTASNFCGESTQSIDYQVVVPTTTQISQTAEEFVAPNDRPFRPGILTRYAPAWTDEQQADIAAGNAAQNVEGAGVKSLKVLLPEDFLETFGYDIRLNTFQHYVNLDLQENTAILGFPGADVVENWPFCATNSSGIFEKLYLDIWDGGTNGTPINEQNPFANYVWQAVKTYRDQVKYWQIYDAADYDISSKFGSQPPGQPGNWWDNDPEPCDLNLHAPVEYYVRMLRIAYEIVHSTDPDGLVLLGGIGYQSFLDVILRNSDNPTDGSIAPNYPKKGGAYFDAIGFNEYPFVDGSTKYYDTNLNAFVYKRHSDAAADGMLLVRKRFEDVLKNRGFDGNLFPQKRWLVSETGVSQKQFLDYFAGPIAQRNWLLKAWVAALKSGFSQMTMYNLSDGAEVQNAQYPNDLMGIYANIQQKQPYNAIKNDLGWAYQTASLMLFKTNFDSAKTTQIMLPAGVRGGAFRDILGKYTFVIWAATSVDQSELASANYQFPSGLVSANLTRFEWNYAQTKTTANQSTILPIALTATPIFLSENNAPLQYPLANFEAEEQEICEGAAVQFYDVSAHSTGRIWSFLGGTPESSTAQNPVITYALSGTYPVSMTATSALGEHTTKYYEFIKVRTKPTANFTFSLVGAQANFANTSSIDADSIKWLFWDGAIEFGYAPSRYFFQNGTYPLTLVAYNECGSDTITQIIQVQNAPMANFNFILPTVCNSLEVGMQNASASSPQTFFWLFPSGSPATSSDLYPTVTYPAAGDYSVTLIVTNQYGADTMVRIFSLQNAVYNQLNPSVCAGGEVEIAGEIFDETNPSGSVLLPNASAMGCDSIIVVEVKFFSNPATYLTATIFQNQTYLFDNQLLTQAGTYFDTLTTAGSCDSLLVLTLDVLVGSTEIFGLFSDLKIRPNPTADESFITFETAENGAADVEIYSAIGGRVSQQKINFLAGKNQIRLPSEALSSGVFRVCLKNEHGVFWVNLVRI